METTGQVNYYKCRICGGRIVTRLVDDGVTPMMMACRATRDCKGTMMSGWYNIDQETSPTHEWFRPSKEEMAKESREMREHYRQGGLDIREVSE